MWERLCDIQLALCAATGAESEIKDKLSGHPVVEQPETQNNLGLHVQEIVLFNETYQRQEEDKKSFSWFFVIS